MTSHFARNFNINFKRRINSKQRDYCKFTSYISYLTQVKDSQSSTLDAACSLSFSSCGFANSQRTLRPSSGSSYQGQGLHLVHIWSGLPIYQGQGQGQVRRLPALSSLAVLQTNRQPWTRPPPPGSRYRIRGKVFLVLPEVCHIPEMFCKW